VIFVDTSFWVAVSASREQRHAESLELMRRVADAHLVTSNLVLGETWTFMRRRYGHGPAMRLLDRAERSKRVRVEQVTDRSERDAWRWLRRHDERPYSFVDATSFALMRTMRIREALAFDGDFAAAGFTELRA
jgi:predicted nucleic acid-binding protein